MREWRDEQKGELQKQAGYRVIAGLAGVTGFFVLIGFVADLLSKVQGGFSP